MAKERIDALHRYLFAQELSSERSSDDADEKSFFRISAMGPRADLAVTEWIGLKCIN